MQGKLNLDDIIDGAEIAIGMAMGAVIYKFIYCSSLSKL